MSAMTLQDTPHIRILLATNRLTVKSFVGKRLKLQVCHICCYQHVLMMLMIMGILTLKFREFLGSRDESVFFLSSIFHMFFSFYED